MREESKVEREEIGEEIRKLKKEIDERGEKWKRERLNNEMEELRKKIKEIEHRKDNEKKGGEGGWEKEKEVERKIKEKNGERWRKEKREKGT